MRLYLIRHGKTYGNTQGRYIGTTNEPLCEEGREALEKKPHLYVERVYASPLLRCIQTADILCPGQEIRTEKTLSECDFGAFENKNYQELNKDPDYQRWIDSGGTMAFPGGESQEQFRSRCIAGFEMAVAALIRDAVETAVFVVHGGTIMAILDAFSSPHQDFYSWQVKNGEGFFAELDSEQWKKGKREVKVRGSWEAYLPDDKEAV